LLTIAGVLELTTLAYRNCDHIQLNSAWLKHCATELTITWDNTFQHAFALGAIMHHLFIQLLKLQQSEQVQHKVHNLPLLNLA